MSFEQAVIKSNTAKSSNKKLSNDQLLQLYAHYKQATLGPNKTPKPSLFDIKGLAKWNSWSALGNMAKDQAKSKYVQLVNQYC